jgi:hypothetical protein
MLCIMEKASKASDELRDSMMWVMLTKQESHIIAELARREDRSKSYTLRVLLLEALRARAGLPPQASATEPAPSL